MVNVIRKLKCKIFGHSFRYYVVFGAGDKAIRTCTCGFAQTWKKGYHSMVWMNMIEYTKYGAEMWAKRNDAHLNCLKEKK